MPQGEVLDAAVIRAGLGKQRLGNRIVVLEETTSTNDAVAQMAAESEEGLVVIAEHQTAGRGQYGRRWESAARKGLWLSLLMRPKIAVAESGRITDLLVRAIAASLEEQFGISSSIKPPNDVYAAGRKIAGVLVEMRVEASGSYCAIGGMGLNVNHALEDFPAELRDSATSVAIITGRTVDRGAIAIALLRQLDRRYQRFHMTL
ncbi:MAG: biotin--[acetyl-CoA-carboxylase] ligase [Chthoniobacterales bacterium]